MNGQLIMSTAKGILSRAGFICKKHLPEICLYSGAILVVGGTVAACKKTLKMPEIMAKTKEEINGIHAIQEECARQAKYAKEDPSLPVQIYPDKERRKDLTKAYVRCGWRVVKNYAVPFALEAGGLALIFGGHAVLNKRHTQLALAYATLSEAYMGYRKRIEEKFGEKVDKETLYGIHEEVVETEKSTNEGKTKVVKKTYCVSGEPLSPYARCFEKGCPGWVPDPELRLMHLQNLERTFTDFLRAKGFVWLNEVYVALGFPETTLGHKIGWVYDPSDTSLQNCISFDLTNIHRQDVRDFRNGYEDALWIDFNVDGLIMEKAVRLGWIHEDRRTA